MSLTVLVLAGGGEPGSPDALRPVDGGSALSVVLRTLGVAGLDAVIVVLGESAGLVLSRTALGSARAIEIPAGGRMIDALRAGLDAVPAASTGVLVFPVNHPLVSIGTARALAGAHEEACERGEPGAITIPVCDVPGLDEGRRGHPIVFAREVWDELRSPRADSGADAVVHAHPELCREVRVLDRGILASLQALDTRRLLERMQAQRAREEGGSGPGRRPEGRAGRHPGGARPGGHRGTGRPGGRRRS